MQKLKIMNFPQLKAPPEPQSQPRARLPSFQRQRRLFQSQDSSMESSNLMGRITPQQAEIMQKCKISGVQRGKGSTSRREKMHFPLLRPLKTKSPSEHYMSFDNYGGEPKSPFDEDMLIDEDNFMVSPANKTTIAIGTISRKEFTTDLNTLGPDNNKCIKLAEDQSNTSLEPIVNRSLQETDERNVLHRSPNILHSSKRKMVHPNVLKSNSANIPHKVKIENLEKKMRVQMNIIQQLKEENDSIMRDYISMKNINKNLLNNISGSSIPYINNNLESQNSESTNEPRKNLSDIHSLYQELYLNDSVQEIEKAKNESRIYRMESIESKNESDKLRKEIVKLWGVIKRYRKVINDMNSNLKTGDKRQGSGAIDFNSPKSSRAAFCRSISPKSLAKESQDDQFLGSAKDSNTNITKQRLLLLHKTVASIKNSSKISEIFERTLKAMPDLIPFNKIGIFVISKELLKIKGGLTLKEGIVQKGLCMKQPCDIISDVDINIPDPLVESIDQCKLGLQTNEAIGLGSFSQNDNKNCYFYIQLEREKTPKSKSLFTRIDDMILQIICNTLGFRFDNKINERIIATKDKSIQDSLNIFIELSSQRTMVKLVNKCQKLLPGYLGYKDFGLLLYDSKNKELYTLYETIGSEVAQAIRYPTGIGITGELLKKPSIRVCNDIRRESKFNNDIDNIHNLANPTSFLFAPIYSFNHRLLGFVQVLCKNVGNIENIDVDNFAPIQRLIGILVEKITEMTITMNLTLGFRNTLLALLNLSKESGDDQSLDSAIGMSQLSKSLEHLNGLVGNISESNKGAENVLLYGEIAKKKDKLKKQPTYMQRFAQSLFY